MKQNYVLDLIFVFEEFEVNVLEPTLDSFEWDDSDLDDELEDIDDDDSFDDDFDVNEDDDDWG